MPSLGLGVGCEGALVLLQVQLAAPRGELVGVLPPGLEEVGRCLLDDRRQPWAVGESSVSLLHPPLPLAGVSIWTERGCQQNDSLTDGQADPKGSLTRAGLTTQSEVIKAIVLENSSYLLGGLCALTLTRVSRSRCSSPGPLHGRPATQTREGSEDNQERQ